VAEPGRLSDDEQRTWRAFLAATRRVFAELDRELQRDAGTGHVEGVRRHLFDRLSPAQVGQLRAVSEAILGGRP